jgi:tetrapyrrole methylase family protein/MazG family protein
MGITIVGLGPGDGRYLTGEAWAILSEAETIYLRTERHPVISDLPVNLEKISFDDVYESADRFEEVYEEIVDRLLTLARENERQGKELVYCVPGHPLVGESTVTLLASVAETRGIDIHIVPGLSFIEPALQSIGVDALDGIQLFDGIEIAGYFHPPISCDIPLLIGQVYGKRLASDLKLALMSHYRDDHEVILVHAAGTREEKTEKLPLYAIDRSTELAHLTSLYVPASLHRSTLAALAETVAYLRSPDGCPWDQEQTHRTLRQGFLEEVSEVLEAIDKQDPESLREELGDVLYHVVMQAQIASEEGEFLLSEVIAGIEAKLKRRHPHVWGDIQVADSAEVVRNWESQKEQEEGKQTSGNSQLGKIPLGLPSLARAQKIQKKVQRVGFDWPDISGVKAKVNEEFDELVNSDTHEEQYQELGDLIFAVVNWARWLEIDAESALREANIRFIGRFESLERIAENNGQILADMEIDQLEALWEQAKSEL